MEAFEDFAPELAFPADYEVSVVRELPGAGGPLHEFSRDGRVDGGVNVEVTSSATHWKGLIANAPETVQAAHSGIYSTPDIGSFCVVARGDAYFIEAASPDAWWVLEDSPVVAVRNALRERLLLLATPWRVIAVGARGVAWRTSRMAIDGIALGETVDGQLAGVADPDDDESRDFTIELRTGYHRGGFPFPG